MSTTRKLWSGFGAPVLIVAVTGLVAGAAPGAKRFVESVTAFDEPAAAYEVGINALETGRGVLGYVQTGDPRHDDRVDEARADLRELHERYDRPAENERGQEATPRGGLLHGSYRDAGKILKEKRDELPVRIDERFDKIAGLHPLHQTADRGDARLLPEEWTSDPELWISTLHPEDRERVLAEDARADETLEPFGIEHRMIFHDGRSVWVLDEATMIQDEANNPLHWQGFRRRRRPGRLVIMSRRASQWKGRRVDAENGGSGTRRFNTASDEEIREAYVADSYFHRAMEVLRARGLQNVPVHAEVTYKTSDPDEWFVVAGLDEVASLFEGVGVEARAVAEGTICHPYEPVLTLAGPYGAFAEHETAILGFLCQASGVATGAARCRIAAGERPVISFGARRMHPAITPMIERAAYLGGCDSVAVDLATERLGIPASGTLPHALALILGSTAEAARAFDEVIDPAVQRTILIDTFDDEKFGALLAARAIPDSIYGVRLDTPGNRRGDFRDLMREVRWELDRNGFDRVRIVASGGVGVDDILLLNPVCDAYGVGGAIADAPMIDYSLDIVEVDGTDRSKRGKHGGKKRLLELDDGFHAVIPAGAPVPEGARDLLEPLRPSPQDVAALRQRVLDQLATGRFGL